MWGYSDDEEYCVQCERYFVNETAIHQHWANSSLHHDTYCGRCQRNFVNEQSKAQHVNDSYSHWICETKGCNLDFGSFDQRQQHWRQEPTKHFFCRPCDEKYDSAEMLRNHKIISKRHHYCKTCNEEWNTAHLYQSHFKHSPNHFWCSDCERLLASQNELTQHLKIHRKRDIICAGGCKQTFACPSAIMIHWETGSCTPGRQSVYREVESFDEHSLITIPRARKFLTRMKNRHRQAFSEDYNSDDDSWDCPYCDYYCARSQQLTAHLKSPHHDPQLFKCPSSSCDYTSTVLSGLYQHTETTFCDKTTGCLDRLWDCFKDYTMAKQQANGLRPTKAEAHIRSLKTKQREPIFCMGIYSVHQAN